MQTHPAREETTGNVIGGILVPLPHDFEIRKSGFEDLDNNFGNWNYGDYVGKTKGWWMHIYDPDKKPPNPDSDLWPDYQNRQAYLDYINEHSTVFGDEPFGFGQLTLDNVYDILKTNDTRTGYTTDKAMYMMESQFLATWLNIAAGYIDWDANVYLTRLTGCPVPPWELFGGEVVPISQIITITENAVTETFQSNFTTGWGHDQYITALMVFTFINEAEHTYGAPFRPPLDP